MLSLKAGLKIEGILKLKMVLKCRDHCICNFQPDDIASLSYVSYISMMYILGDTVSSLMIMRDSFGEFCDNL